MDNNRHKTFPSEEIANEPCEPCEAEEKERAAQQMQFTDSHSRYAALATQSPMEPTRENLLLAVQRGREMFSGELHKLNELEMFLEENDVPDSVIIALYHSHRHFLEF